MPRVDAEARELRAGRCDVGVRFRITLVGAGAVRGEQAEVLELLREPMVDAGPLAELVQRDRLLLRAERRRLAPLALLLARRVQLVLDHAQRQELVALQAQDRLQPLEVGLAEEAVAAPRAARGQQAPVLPGAGLWDRDGRGLLRPAAGDPPPAKQPP